MFGVAITICGVLLISWESTTLTEETDTTDNVMDDSDDTLSEHTSLLSSNGNSKTYTY
jgi:hypothetical protein